MYSSVCFEVNARPLGFHWKRANFGDGVLSLSIFSIIYLKSLMIIIITVYESLHVGVYSFRNRNQNDFSNTCIFPAEACGCVPRLENSFLSNDLCSVLGLSC